MINPLVVIPSPREVKIVHEQIENILYGKFDIFYLKYFTALTAYNIALKTTLRHPEYDGMILIPDDIVLTQELWDKFYKAVSSGKYEMISGVCNLSAYNQEQTKLLNITQDIIPDIFAIPHNIIKDLWIKDKDLPKTDKPMKVAYAGFAVTYFSRKFLENMKEFKENGLRQSRDVQTAKWARENKIDQYIVPSARFLHLRGHPDESIGADRILTGQARPFFKFINKQKKVTIKQVEPQRIPAQKEIVAKVTKD